MKIKIVALGRNIGGPEHALVKDYLKRARAIGKSLGINEIEIIELDDWKKKLINELNSQLLKKGNSFVKVISLDSEGDVLTSESFAALLRNLKSDNFKEVFFLIGGPDGIPAEVLINTNLSISFGRFTYPHLLVRAMLLEQIYRATTILAKHPYHRA